MDQRLQLEIVTPEEPVLSEEATEVILPGEVGEVGILPGHVPLITSLKTGAMRVHENGLTKKLFVDGGFAEVLDNTINVLAERCEFAEDIDVEEAKSNLESLQQELEDLEEQKANGQDIDEDELEDTKEQIRRAKARITVATDGEFE